MVAMAQHLSLYADLESRLKRFDAAMSDEDIEVALVEFCATRQFEVTVGKFNADLAHYGRNGDLRRFYIKFDSSVAALTFAWDCHLKSIGTSSVLVEVPG